MCNIYNEQTAFYSWKKGVFLLADIGMLVYFLVLEKKKTKMCSADHCRPSIFKKDQEKHSEKFYCPIHQIKKCKKKTRFF